MNPEDGLELLRSDRAWKVEFRPAPDAMPGVRRSAGWKFATIAISSVAAVAVIGTALFLTVGLRPHTTIAGPAPTETTTPEPSSPPTSSASPTPDPISYEGSATCSNLLDPSTIQAFAAEDWTPTGSRYEENVRETNEYPAANFLEYGGIICGWGSETWGVEFYGYGPISPAQEADEREAVETSPAVLTHDRGYDIYTVTDSENPSNPTFTMIFGDGTWAYSRDNGGGDVIDDIIGNAP